MSLYLGKAGRSILRSIGRHSLSDRAVDAFSHAAHKVTRGRYTPGLTRNTFRYYDHIRSEVSGTTPQYSLKMALPELGVYGTEYISIKSGSFTPENLARFARSVKAADKAFSPYKEGMYDRIKDFRFTLKQLFRHPVSMETLIELNGILTDYAVNYGDPADYFRHMLFPFMSNPRQHSLLEWDAAARSLIGSLKNFPSVADGFADRLFALSAFRILAERVSSPEELSLLKEMALKYSDNGRQMADYIENGLMLEFQDLKKKE